MAKDSFPVHSQPETTNSTAYLLWLLSAIGVCGAHRFYLGKPLSGIVYLFTFGLFGMGQLIDLVLIPGMVEDRNLRYRMLHGSSGSVYLPPIVVNMGEGYPQSGQFQQQLEQPRLDVQILRACRDHQGATLSDCVIATEASPEEVKAIVKELCRADLLAIDNRESDGAVIYKAV